jgi:hypothetical protein
MSGSVLLMPMHQCFDARRYSQFAVIPALFD